MKKPQEIFLKDYTPASYNIITVDIIFDIFEEKTIVSNISTFENNKSKGVLPYTPINILELDGIDLKLLSVEIDGKKLEKEKDEYEITKNKLILKNIPENFTLKTVVEIDPANNKQLMGLYKSDNIFCTQNEPEGFRRITYHLDRPDVMSIYTTILIADKEKYPILLSNGNCIEKKEIPSTGSGNEPRHMTKWEDPFKKPCYLFAVVAGNLVITEDSFTTMSGKIVPLKIYTDKGNETRVSHAMESLKKAMKWDEEKFGREYDLDIFMIVAVDAFNAGAMENKGLNIFNSAAILCDQRTATDADFKYIEAVVAHEYFHNWTGNRITCRDWFQLTLKEGLTVFRDSEFSSDMGDRTVKRIEDASYMREGQFAEDAGPMAHPIQPQSFMEIENFYTVTVYEKGCEVIRMLKTMYGEEQFRKAMDLYFETFDGQAVTIEEFLWSFEKALDIDLTQFKESWYFQAGTPVLECWTEYNAEKKEYMISFEQSCEFPKKENEKPYMFPLDIGLLDTDGKEIKSQMHVITEKKESIIFRNIESEPIPSLLRNFSAPIKLKYTYSLEENIFLFLYDTDNFNRYEAGQRIARQMIADIMDKKIDSIPVSVIEAYKKVIYDKSLTDSFKAECLTFPGLFTLVSENETYEYKKAYNAKKIFIKTLTDNLSQELLDLYHAKQNNIYSIDEKNNGARALKNICLSLLSECSTDYTNIITTQFEIANNMTDRLRALALLCKTENIAKQNALFDFKQQWKNDTLVMNKWFAVQMSMASENILDVIKNLEKDETFDMKNPNKIRSLFGCFGRNYPFFHSESGENYEYLSEKILEIDQFNNKASSGLAQIFRQYAKMPKPQKKLIKQSLEKILNTEKISDGLFEVVQKTLESGEK